MKLIVGLGNPGPKYQMNRHNLGFLALDRFAEKHGSTRYREESRAHVLKMQVGTETVILAKPQTYMNLSGESVQPLLDYYKIEPKDLLVVHDEIDLPFLAIKFQSNRGHGGHNGIRSIHAILGRQDYDRLKLGVGRSAHAEQDVASYLLEDFTKDQQKEIDPYLDVIADALAVYAQKGLNLAATQFNKAPKEE